VNASHILQEKQINVDWRVVRPNDHFRSAGGDPSNRDQHEEAANPGVVNWDDPVEASNVKRFKI
jgi:hypothetical protein